MIADLYSPFFKATHDVFQLMLDLSDISDRPADTFVCDDEIDVSIGIVGDLTGEVTYRFPRETSISMVNIMSGMEVDSVDDFVTSAISEIANIISGNVLTILAGNNLQCDILPPVLRKSDAGKKYTLHKTYCMNTSVGDVCLEIRLNETVG